MIGKLTRTIVRTFAFALTLCATISAWAVPPTATVVWESDFNTATKTGTDGNSYTITLNGNSVNAAGNLTIDKNASSGLGATIDISAAAPGAATVLIKYSNLAAVTIHENLAAFKDSAGGERGAYRTTDTFNLAMFENANSNNHHWTPSPAGTMTAGSGYFVGNYSSSAGTFAYSGSLISRLSGTGRSDVKSLDKTIQTISIGGPCTYLSSGTSGVAWDGVVIEKVAIFIGNAYSNTDLVSFVWPSSNSKYAKWAYSNRVMTWKTAANATGNNGDFIAYAGATYDLFDIASGADSGTPASNGNNESSLAYWKTFCFGQDGYSAPGNILRLAGDYYKVVHGKFSPMTLGGLIVEPGATGYSFPNENTRSAALGDPTGVAETWFEINEDFSISRIGGVALMGTVNLDIASGKTLTFSSAAKMMQVASVDTVTAPHLPYATTTGGTLKMHGLGKLSVSTLTATGGATLDFADVQEDADVVRSTTPFIQGNLTVDSSTRYVFPSSLAKNTAYKLCSGTLTAPASVICDITVGTTVKKNVPLTFSGNTVSYGDPVYGATVDGTTVTWVGDEPSSFDDIVVTFSGSGTVTGLSGSGTTINAADGVTVDVTSFTSPTLLGTGTFRYTSGYPTTIPSAEYSYEYVGGATEATKVTVSDVLTINGNLKTSGYIALTGENTLAAGGSLEVLSDKTELAAVPGVKANGWSGGLGGTITVDANAELANLTTDALTRSGSLVNINVYGTLNFGTTRWTMQSSQYHRLNLYGNAEVKGSGVGNGILDFENENSSVNISVRDGTSTISGPLKFRAKTIAWIAPNAKLAVTGGTIDNSEFAKSGAGTLSFSAVAPSTTGGLSASEGTIELDNISYTAGTIKLSSSSESPTLKMIATDAATTVSATVDVPANTRGQLAFEGAGTFALSGPNRNNNIVWLGTNLAEGTLNLAGDVTINNGSRGGSYVFNKVSGSGTLTLSTWEGCYNSNDNGLTYTINTIDADSFAGAIALKNVAAPNRQDGNNNCTLKFAIGDIKKSSAVYGTAIVGLTTNITAGAHGVNSIDVDLSSTTFNNSPATFLYDGSTGVYLAEASYNGTPYKTLDLAITAMETAEGNPADIIVYNSAATIPSGYALVGGTRLRKVGGNIYWTRGTYWAASGGSAVFSTAASGGETTTYVAGDTVVIPDTTTRYLGAIGDGAKLRYDCNGTITIYKSGDIESALKNAEVTVAAGTTLQFARATWNGTPQPEIVGCSFAGEGAITVPSGTTLAVSGNVSSAISFGGEGTVNVASDATLAFSGSATVSSTLAGTGEISFATLPSSALTLGEDWTGTVELPVLTADQAYQLNNYGKTNSTIRLNGLSDGWLEVAAPITVNANLELAGDWNLSEMSTREYNFATISGTGNMSFATALHQPTSINIATLSGYSGAITNNTTATLTIGTLALGSGADVSVDAKLLSTGGTGTGKFSVASVTVGGEAQTLTLAYRSDGVYVRGVASYDNVEYKTIQEAINAAEQAGHTYEDVTILVPAATCPDEYYVDTEDNNALKMCQAAVVDTEGTAHYYATAQAAFDAVDSYVSGPVYDYFAIYYGTDISISVNPSKNAWTYGATVKVKNLNGSSAVITLDSDEYTLDPSEPVDGIVSYSKKPVATTYVWVGATSDGDAFIAKQWSRPTNWRVGTSDGATASRYPSCIDTANIPAGAYVTVISVADSLTITGGGTITAANGISLTAAGATISVTGVTLSPEPTVADTTNYRVRKTTVDGTTTYTVVDKVGSIFSVY